MWSLADADAALQELRPQMQSMQQDWQALHELDAELQELADRHAGTPPVDDPEHILWRAVAERREELAEGLQQELAALQRRGIHVKDPATGLVDFEAELLGRSVWLCWRLGEPRVAHYHDLEGGFAGRQPIPDVGDVNAV